MGLVVVELWLQVDELLSLVHGDGKPSRDGGTLVQLSIGV